MLAVLLTFLLFVFLFFRQVKIDSKQFLKLDRQNDDHILREIEKFKNKMGVQQRQDSARQL